MEKEGTLKDYVLKIEETIGKTVVVEGCPSLEAAIEFVREEIVETRIELNRVYDFLDRKVFPDEYFKNGTEKGEIVDTDDVSDYEEYEYADENLAYLLVCCKNGDLLYKAKTAEKADAINRMKCDAVKVANNCLCADLEVSIDFTSAYVLSHEKEFTYTWEVTKILPRNTRAYALG